MIDINLVDFAEFMADEVRKKTKPRFRGEFDVEQKPDDSPVTIADKEAEEEIRKLIAMNYPEHGVFGEEFDDKNLDAEYVWVIDPIDGTKSFIAGRPIFGTLIALLQNGEPLLGLIDQPILEERWFAHSGESKFNLQDIRTRKCEKLEDAFFACTSLAMFNTEETERVDKIRSTCKQQIWGGDCYNYGLLAMGNLDVIIESDMKPFDYMALVPIIKNAGGEITDWKGGELNLNSNGQVLACGDKELHKKIIELL